MRETGCITEIKSDKVLVQLDFKGGCGNCSLNGVCKSDGTGKRELLLSAGRQDLKPGDLVEIETAPRSLLTAAFLVFIFPLILSFGAYLLMFQFTGSRGWGLAGFFICFAAALLFVSLIDKITRRGKFFEPQIVSKI